MSTPNQTASNASILELPRIEWDFSPQLDIMLKADDGYAYIFAMTEGTSGERTFTLPKGTNGDTDEVLCEDRTIEINGKKFTDSFAEEFSYHIYKLKI